MPAANDLFANAVTLSPSSGGTIGWDATGLPFASFEVNEPAYAFYPFLDPVWDYGFGGYYTLWYKITPAVDGALRLTTTGTPISIWPLLTVYTGSTLATLVLAGYGGINSGGSYQASVTVDVQAGVQYYVKIGTSGFTTTSAGVLNWVVATPPANDDFADAILISGASGSTTGTTVGATSEDDEPALPYYFGDGDSSIWWKWVAPSDGVVAFDFNGSAVDVLSALFHGTTLTGLALVGTTDLWTNSTASTGGESLTQARVLSGETYYLKVVGVRGAWAAVAFSWSLAAPTVTNDYYENATVISGASGSLSASLAAASSEEGEPWLYTPGTYGTDLGRIGGQEDYGGFSVWYEWTCPADGVYEFNTYGSDAWTLLGVFHDAADLASIDQATGRANGYGGGSANNYRSLVTIQATSGQVFKITVQGDYGDRSDFLLNWSTVTPPVNDNVVDAIELVGITGSLSGTNTGATYEDGELKPLELNWEGSGRSVWYKVDVGAWGWFDFSGDLDFNGEGGYMAVFTGPENASSAAELSPLLDDGFPVYDWGFTVFPVSFNVGASGWVYVQVDGYEGAYGDFTLDWSIRSAVRSDDYVGPPNKSGSRLFINYFEVTEADRNFDLDVIYSCFGGLYTEVILYTDLEAISVPATPGSTSAFGTLSSTDYYRLAGPAGGGLTDYGPIDTYMDETAEATGSGKRRTMRFPLPERAGILGVSVYAVTNGTLRVSEYHASVTDPIDPPVNDNALQATVIGGPDGSSGQFVITREDWSGATVEPGEPILTNSDELSGVAVRGRTMWFEWTPENDSDVLYFWAAKVPDDDTDMPEEDYFLFRTDPIFTVFTAVGDPWNYVIALGRSLYDFVFEIDTVPKTGIGWESLITLIGPNWWENPYFNAPIGSYQYIAVPGRHDVDSGSGAGTGAGIPTYIRVDLAAESLIPPKDWQFGWFVHDEKIRQYGPDNLTILSVGDYAGNDSSRWFKVGEQDNFDDPRPMDPTWVAISGRLSASLDLPHPFTESELVGDQTGFFADAFRTFEYGDVDDDGVVYAPAVTGSAGDEVTDILVWDNGLLNLPTEGVWRDAIIESGVEQGRTGYFARLVGNELWAWFDAFEEDDRFVRRFSLEGAYLGPVARPPGYLDWDYLYPVHGGNRNRFLMSGYATVPGLDVYASKDVSAQVQIATAIKFSPTGSRMWIVDHTTSDFLTAYIYQYDLSTPYRVATASYSGSMPVTIAGVHPLPSSVSFDTTGTTMFVGGVYISAINIYSLSTPYDITTATYTGFSTAVDVGYGTPIVFRPDGLRMYSSSVTFEQYNLTTPFVLSTASLATTTPLGVFSAGSPWFSADGTTLYGLSSAPNGGYIVQYTLSVPWEISSISTIPVASYYVAGIAGDAHGLERDPITGHYYVLSRTTNTVYELVPSAGVSTPTLSVYNADSGLLSPTGLPAQSGAWQSWRDGVIRTYSGGSSIFFTAAIPGTPSTDVAGTGFDIIGQAAIVHTWYPDVSISATWTGAFPGGIIFRFVNINNYLLAGADGLYEVVNGVKTLIQAYTSSYVFGSNATMTVTTFNSSIGISGPGGTKLSILRYRFHSGPRSTWGLGHGVWSNVGGFSPYSNFGISSTTSTITADVVGEGWEDWDGSTYLAQNWNLVNQILADPNEGVSPWFDTYSQNWFDLGIAADGTTAYLVRWWEAYEANARDSKMYGDLTGNWIVSSVYAFDIATQTYLGKVGQYDAFPSFGMEDFYNTVYPYVVIGGDVWAGDRGNAKLKGETVRIGRPLRFVAATIDGTTPTDRGRRIADKNAPTARGVGTGTDGLVLRWYSEGTIFRGSLDAPVPVDVNGELSNITLTADVASLEDTLVVIYRDDIDVATVTLEGEHVIGGSGLSISWAANQTFSFTVLPGDGLEGIAIEATWS